MSSPIILPPGFELEQDDASGIKLPPGYELEQKTLEADVKLPPGYKLEQQSPPLSVRLPVGYELEQNTVAHGIKLPPGFELETPPSTDHLDRDGFHLEQQPGDPGVRPPDQPGPQKLSAPVQATHRPKPVAPITRNSSAFSAGQAGGSDSNAETRKAFENFYAQFFDSDQAQVPSQNIPSNARGTIHWGDRSWASASPETIARVRASQTDKATAPVGSAQRPGATSRFRDSMGQAMGVPPVMSDYWEGPKMAVAHPVESAKLLSEAAGQAEQDLVDKAYWYQHRPGFGNKLKGLAYGIYSLIPFAGSSLAHSGEQFEQGDFAGGFGTTLVLPRHLSLVLKAALVNRVSVSNPAILWCYLMAAQQEFKAFFLGWVWRACRPKAGHAP